MGSPTPTLGQRRLARVLRRLRSEAGLTIDQVAEKLDLSPSTVSRMETAQASVRRPDARALLEIYGVTGEQREELLQLVEESRQQPWWGEYRDLPTAAAAGLEAEAATVLQFSAMIVPGILQTEAYAREILRAIRLGAKPKDIDRLLRLRMDRQALLIDHKTPEYRVVLDEAVLRRMVGGPQVMHEQLKRLIETAALPNVTLQVLPYAVGANAGMDGEFTIFTYSEPTDPDVVFIENSGGDAYIENPKVTKRYNSIFESLRAAALEPVKSIGMLTDIEQELQSCL